MLSTTSQPDMSKSKIVIVEPGWVKKLLKVDIGNFFVSSLVFGQASSQKLQPLLLRMVCLMPGPQLLDYLLPHTCQ